MQYTAGQPYIDWGIIYESLHEYRKKAKEQSKREIVAYRFRNRNLIWISLDQNEQILWTEIYRPKSSKAFLGNHTRQIKRLNEWFTYWTTKLQTEPLGKIERIKRKRPFDEEDDDGDSSKSKKKTRTIFLSKNSGRSRLNKVDRYFNDRFFREKIFDRKLKPTRNSRLDKVRIIWRLLVYPGITSRQKKFYICREKKGNEEYFGLDFSQSSSNFCKPEHPRLIFIHGSGTTSLVHAFAEEFNFKVIDEDWDWRWDNLFFSICSIWHQVTEINGSQTRSKTPLLKQLEQMTSHQLSFKRCPSDPINSQGNQKTAYSVLLFVLSQGDSCRIKKTTRDLKVFQIELFFFFGVNSNDRSDQILRSHVSSIALIFFRLKNVWKRTDAWLLC